jgi:hypothetical protein
MSYAGIEWQKSSFSGANGEDCVELASVDGAIVMRESDDPGVVLATTPEVLRAFIQGVKTGDFDHLV